MHASPELERFVRDILGCGCPDTVFEHVIRARGPLWAGGNQAAEWIGLGGRLLVAVVDRDAAAGLHAGLAAACTEGLRRRDAGGFNRFRLVVPSIPGLDRAALEQAFAPHGAANERLHLHLVAPEDLPP